MQHHIKGLLVAFTLAFSGGCIDELDREVDCANICERYEDCLPGDQDQGACRDRCDNSPTGQVDACDSCLDESACAECSFECADPLHG